MKEKIKLDTIQIILLCIAVVSTAFGVYQTIRHIGADVPVSKTMFICLSYILILYYELYCCSNTINSQSSYGVTKQNYHVL